MEWLISKCLLGDACRYDGKSKPCDVICKLSHRLSYKSVCPEVEGGLNIPRIPSEYDGNVVINAEGEDVSSAYKLGAEKALKRCRKTTCCILKEKSPSCGSEKRYDGTFSATLIDGEGVTTEALFDAGIPVVSEVVVNEVFDEISQGINIIYRFENILPSLAEYYTSDLELMCTDFRWKEMNVFVINEEMDIPDDKTYVLIDIDYKRQTQVFIPKVKDVRSFHEAKKEYFFDCLVAEALETNALKYIAFEEVENSPIKSRAILHIGPSPYRDIIAKLYMTTLRLHEFLYMQ